MSKGKKVGKYELGRVLGSGAFSSVKLGMDESGRQVAVKVIEKEQVIREKLEEQLKLEISVMRSLNHPNIVRLFDVLQTSNNIYIILELVTGGELFDRIVSARRFNEPTARRYFQQLIVALQFCHAQGIAHRDLKPENLLLSDTDTIKITDFGLATMHPPGKPNTLEYTLCGTPNYLAPEMLKDRGYIPVMADVWSVGVILYVMLSGALPFDDPDLPTLFKKIERGVYKVFPGFSDSAKDLIGRMLTLDPARRPTLLQVMQHPWFTKDFDRSVWDGLNGTTVNAVPTGGVAAGGGAAGASAGGAAAAGGAGSGGAGGGGGPSPAFEGKQVAEKDTAHNPALAMSDQLGAFDLVSQLSMVAIRTMTTNHPVIKISTRFIVGQAAATALKSILAALGELGMATAMAEGSASEVKASANKPKGLLTASVTVCSFVDPDMCLVEVRRGRGDTFDFHEMYHSLVEKLGPLVLSKPVEEA